MLTTKFIFHLDILEIQFPKKKIITTVITGLLFAPSSHLVIFLNFSLFSFNRQKSGI